MDAENIAPITLRDAQAADLLALAAIRPPEATHKGRLRDTRYADLRYFSLLHDEIIVGFVSLVFRRPSMLVKQR